MNLTSKQISDIMALATCVKICHNGEDTCDGCPIEKDPKRDCNDKNTELANKVLSIFDSERLFVMTKTFGVGIAQQFHVNEIYELDRIDVCHAVLGGREEYYVFDHEGNSIDIGGKEYFEDHFRPLQIGDHVVVGKSGTEKYSITSEGWKGTIMDFLKTDLRGCRKVSVECSIGEGHAHFDLDVTDLSIDPHPDCKPRFANGLYEAIEASSGITKGKQYSFVDGFATNDDGDTIDNFGYPMLDTSKEFTRTWKKVEFVGPEKDGRYLYTGNRVRNSNTWVEIKDGLCTDYKHTRRPVTISELKDDYIPCEDVELMNGYFVYHATDDAKYAGFTDKHVYLFYNGTIDKDDQNRTRFNELLTVGFGPIPKNQDLQHPVQRKFVEHFKQLEVGMFVKRSRPRPTDPGYDLIFKVEAVYHNLPGVYITRKDTKAMVPGSLLMVVDEPEEKTSKPINGLYASMYKYSDLLPYGHIFKFENGKARLKNGWTFPISRVILEDEVEHEYKIRPLEVGDHVVATQEASQHYTLTKQGWKGVIEKIDSNNHFHVRDSFPVDDKSPRVFELRTELFEIDPEPEVKPKFLNGYFKCTADLPSRNVNKGDYVRFEDGVGHDKYGRDLNDGVRMLDISGKVTGFYADRLEYAGAQLPKDGLLNGWYKYTGGVLSKCAINTDELVHFIDGKFEAYGWNAPSPVLLDPIPRDITARSKEQENYMKNFAPADGGAFDIGDKVVRRAEISSAKTRLKMGVVYEVRHIYSDGKVILHAEGTEDNVEIWAIIGEIVELDTSKITGVYVYTGPNDNDVIIRKGNVYRFSNGYTRVSHKGSAVVWPSADSSLPGGVPEASRLVVYGFANEATCERLNGEFTGPSVEIFIKLNGIKSVRLGKKEKYTVTNGNLYNSKMEQVNIGGIIWANRAYRNENVKRIMEWLTPIEEYLADGKYVYTATRVRSDGEIVAHPVKKTGFTIGKIYEVKNGFTIDDDGVTRPLTGNKWSAKVWANAGFVKIEE